MSGAGQPIIVVRKKVHHGGHHGGAWKVAYADFVTAMMAFFLVLWLVGQSKEVKASVGGYFRDPAVLDLPGGSGVLDGGPSLETVVEPAAESAERERLEAAVSHIRGELANFPSFQKLRDQVEFSVTPEGLRIDLVEKAESSFFDSGSSTLRGETERILAVIAHELGTLQNDVVIEGHTDSRAYAATDRYSNWELASDRANAARRVMERSGLRPKQISSVAGLADRHLRVPANPLDPRNRRVSILVRNPLMQRASRAPVSRTSAAGRASLRCKTANTRLCGAIESPGTVARARRPPAVSDAADAGLAGNRRPMRGSSSTTSIRSGSVTRDGDRYPRSNCIPSTISSDVS